MDVEGKMLNKILSSEIENALSQHSVKSLRDQSFVIEIVLIECPEDETSLPYQLKARLFTVDKDERKWYKSIREYLAGAIITGRSLKEISDKLGIW